MNDTVDSTSEVSSASRSPVWQVRRRLLLQQAFEFIARQNAAGTGIVAAIRKATRKFRNRSLGNGKKFKLSKSSMVRIWYDFQKRGESAFELHYRYVPRPKREPDPALLNLIVETSIRESKSLRRAFAQVAASVRGKISFGRIRRALPAVEIKNHLLAEARLIRERKAAEDYLLSVSDELRDMRVGAEARFLNGASI